MSEEKGKKIVILILQGVISTIVLLLLFVAFEPAISLGATATSIFTVTQVINGQISFTTLASNIIMSPTLGGITGGVATGATQVAVNTSNLSGYNMTLQTTSSIGMIGLASTTNYIPAYTVASGTTSPDYNFNTPANSARFGYTVGATTTTDVDQKFAWNGSNICNSPGGTTNTTGTLHCWLPASTTPIQIVYRSNPTPSTGATTTLSFQVQINPNPSPVIPNDTYVATTTLTATTNP